MTPDWYTRFFTGLALDLWAQAVPSEETALEAEFLAQALALEPGQSVLDVPCGSGRLSLELAAQGYALTGVDLSAECIAAARKAGSAAARRLKAGGGTVPQWHRGDMRELPWPDGFDGAFCFGNSFGYVDRTGTAAFLAAVAGALRPGARFALDTGMAAESVLPQLDERSWVPVGDLLLLVEQDYNAAESRLDIAYTIVKGARQETRQAHNWIFTVGEISAMLSAAGLRTLGSYGDLYGNPYAVGDPRLLLVAEKPAPRLRSSGSHTAPAGAGGPTPPRARRSAPGRRKSPAAG